MTYYSLAANWPAGLIYIPANGTVEYTFTIRETDKATKIVIAGSDIVRFKLWATGVSAPSLDIDSIGATPNGSLVTIVAAGNGTSIDAQVKVRFAQGDTILLAGDYWGELAIVDDSDSDAYKPVCRGPVTIEASAGGDRGLT